ncbi:MAG TPA: type II secretion system F family protein, partial [Pseudolabrys sp.]|nr:type II secretion system F family protein [Pseudolabrys sp.]
MATSALAIFVSVPGLLLVAIALMLCSGGLVLVGSVFRHRHEILARRVALVQSFTKLAEPEKKGRPSKKKDPFRLPDHGMPEPAQREIARALARFGVPAARSSTYYTASRLVVAAVLGLLMFAWSRGLAALDAAPMVPFLIMFVAAVIGWFLPAGFVAHKVRQRTKLVRAGLPDALELLVVCAEAGLSLEDGLSRIVNELHRAQPALADELGLTLADLKILPSREQALT